MAAYPITPQTSLVEKIAEFIHKGEMKAEYLKVESEHSVMSACIGASIGGARTFSATSSQGLLLMQEMLFWAGYGKLPIVMAVVTRSIAPPWSMWSEHTDALAQRDAGWIQIFCHTNQEVLDTVIQAYKIGEDKDVMLPVMVCFDGFEISHTSENVIIPDQETVDGFLPRYENDIIDTSNPKLIWNGVYPEDAFIFRENYAKSMENTQLAMEKVNIDFEKTFGRRYDQLEFYGPLNPDIIILAMGAVASSAKAAIDILNREGHSVGLLRVRSFRPFPSDNLIKAIFGAQAIVILDRSMTFGKGILATEVKAALYHSSSRPSIHEFIIGMGGNFVKHKVIVKLVKDLIFKIEAKTPSKTVWLKD